MTRILAPLAVAALMLAGSYAFADDEVSEAGMAQQHEMMKDCMAKHAAADRGMTKADMEKACKEEMKARKNHPDKMSDTAEK